MGQKGIQTYQRVHKCYLRLMDCLEARAYQEAVGMADEICEAGTRDKNIWHTVLAAYIDGKKSEKALEAARKYEELFPMEQDGTGHFLVGRSFMLSGDWEEAEKRFQLALTLSMEDWYRGAAYSILANLERKLGRTEQAAAHYLKSVEYKSLGTGKLEDYSNYLFNLHYLDKPQDFMLEAARKYGELLREVAPFRHSPHGYSKLRIGYISPDLRFHVVAFFSYALLKDYDREHFEVYCYTNCQEDNASREFAAGVDGWRNVRGLPPGEIARLIYEDKIDILFDLAGHTAQNMLPVLAFRPAPVQLSGIGYFDTTGLPQVDYFLTDNYLDPPGEPGGGNDRYFTEKLLRLPHSHFCYMWHDAPGETAGAPMLRKGFITFGSLNNFAKVTDEMLRLWARIMEAVPGSRLHLRAEIFGYEYGRKLAFERMKAAGVPVERVEVFPFDSQYLKDYGDIDIALDTYPYPGGGTTCDAIYMGVPVITLVGERHNARFGYSLLMNIGLEELCAFSAEEYVNMAVSLAGDRERLQYLHLNLRQMMQDSPVMQSVPYVRSVEKAYVKIYLAWLQEVGFRWEESGLSWLNNYIADSEETAVPGEAVAEERTVNMSKSSRKLHKKKEKVAKAQLVEKDAGLRVKMKEQMAAEEYADALATLAELVEDKCYDADLMYDGAFSYFMLGDYERATKWVDMVMDTAPYHIPARILLARLCILNEREEGALALSDALLAADRDKLSEEQARDLNDILEYYYRCEPERIRADYPHIAEFVAGAPEQKEATAAPAAEAAPEVAAAKVETAELVQAPATGTREPEGEKDHNIEEELAEIAGKAVALPVKMHLYNVFAGGYFYQKDYESALRFLQEALKIDGHDPETLRNMAILSHELGENDKAQAYASQLPQTDFLLLAALR